MSIILDQEQRLDKTCTQHIGWLNKPQGAAHEQAAKNVHTILVPEKYMRYISVNLQGNPNC